MSPPTRRVPGGGTRDLSNIVPGGTDSTDPTAVAEIIAAIRAKLPTPRRSLWNEDARNRAEHAAWIAGRRRICDLREVVH